MGAEGYRARLHSALTMEEVLVKHPHLRVYLAHAGYPMIDDLLALMYAHPQVYVDVGVIVFTQPRAAFYRYLRRIVEAGFGKRVMFGSDQMVWPGVIERSVRVIEQAPFLTRNDKRDILYNNAARFLRLTPRQRELQAKLGHWALPRELAPSSCRRPTEAAPTVVASRSGSSVFRASGEFLLSP
jgi:predicted TIM-barrel fold metal-dependent hydrolase